MGNKSALSDPRQFVWKSTTPPTASYHPGASIVAWCVNPETEEFMSIDVLFPWGDHLVPVDWYRGEGVKHMGKILHWAWFTWE